MRTTPLRRDAARNRDKVLAAARVAFGEEGVDVGVEEIALRAGVGIGTLYRRFPTKELLIEAIVEEILQGVVDASRAALEHESAADGFGVYVRAVGRLQMEHAGCLPRLWTDSAGDLREQIETNGRALLSKAQAAGSVRPDLAYEDVIVLFWSLRGVIEATAPVAPEAWVRHLELFLTCLSHGGEPLERPPLTPEQVREAKAVPPRQPVRLGAEPG